MSSAKLGKAGVGYFLMFLLFWIVWLSSGWWYAKGKGDVQDATLERELTEVELAGVAPCVRERLRRALAGDDSEPLRIVDLAVAQAACKRKERADAQRAALGDSGESSAN